MKDSSTRKSTTLFTISEVDTNTLQIENLIEHKKKEGHKLQDI